MAKLRRISLALAVVAALSGSAAWLQAQSSDRAKRLGSGMMCMCNCNQILTACNHVGCTVSAEMLRKLDERVAEESSDDLVLQSFVQEYGERVLASPPAVGFNRLAWFIPGFAFVLGLAIVALVLKHWRRSAAAVVTPAPASVPTEWLERGRRQADAETEE